MRVSACRRSDRLQVKARNVPNEPVAARTFHKSGAENEIEPVGAYPGRGWGETGGGPVPTRVSRFKTQTGRTALEQALSTTFRTNQFLLYICRFLYNSLVG